MIDLNWTIKNLRGLFDRYSRLEKSVGHLLESKEAGDPAERMQQFVCRDDFHNLANAISKPELPSAGKAVNALNSLAAFFPAALLLEQWAGRGPTRLWLTAFANHGQCFPLALNERIEIEELLPIPILMADEVRRMSAEKILNRIPLPLAGRQDLSDAYLMMPNSNLALILFSDRSPLIFEENIRRTLLALKNHFASAND